jgi:sulfur carrier protein ThiS
VARISFTRAFERFMPVPALEVAGDTLGAVLAAAFSTRPALRGYVLDDQGALRRHVAVWHNGRPVRDRIALSDKVAPGDEIHVFQALSGG